VFGPIGMPELIVIFLVALLIFGPKKLPEIGKTIGRGLAEFKRASDDLKKTIEDEIEEGKREASAVKREIGAVSNSWKSAADTVAAQDRPAEAEVPVSADTPADSEPAISPDSRPIQPS
jgi:TatA/E family protein of Tat protein translocase